MTRWNIGDLHANHANICCYCNRGIVKPGDLDAEGKWVSTEISHQRALEHNAMLKRGICARVKPEDIVYCVGDAACKGGERGTAGLHKTWAEFLSELPGHWVIVSGNHDLRNKVRCDCEYLERNVCGLSVGTQHRPLFDLPMYEQGLREGNTPIPTEELERMVRHTRYCVEHHAFMITAHVHEKWHVKKIAGIWHVNVGVDVNRYMPVNDNEVLRLYHKALKGKQ